MGSDVYRIVVPDVRDFRPAELAIVAFRPHMVDRCGVDQLRGNPHLLAWRTLPSTK